MGKLVLIVVLLICSLIVIALLIGTILAAIIGSQWAELFGWGENEDDD